MPILIGTSPGPDALDLSAEANARAAADVALAASIAANVAAIGGIDSMVLLTTAQVINDIPTSTATYSNAAYAGKVVNVDYLAWFYTLGRPANAAEVINIPGGGFVLQSLLGAGEKLVIFGDINRQPTNQIALWVAAIYASGSQVNYLGKDWTSNAVTAATDIPGTSTKWVERLSAYNLPLNIIASKNLFDRDSSDIQIDKGVSSGGDINTYTGYKVSAYIPVTENTTYFISGFTGYTLYLQYNNALKVKIGFTSYSETSFTTPAGTAYIIFTCMVNGMASIPALAMVELGNVKTSYAAYSRFEILKDKAVSILKDAKSYGTITDPKHVITKEYLDPIQLTIPAVTTVLGKNLFKIGDVLTGKEIYVDGSIRVRADDSALITAVSAGKTYTYSGFPSSPNTHYGAFLGNDMVTVISAGIVLAANSTTPVTLTAPAGAYYFAASLQGRTAGNTNFTTVQIEESAIATTYEPYESSVKKIQGLEITAKYCTDTPIYDKSIINKEYFDDNINPIKTENKKLLLFGDSITETVYFGGGVRNNWPQVAVPLLAVTYSNYARSGAKFIDWSYTTDAKQKISQQIADAITAVETPDIIVVSIGTNDYPSTLGSYATAMGKATLGDLDKTLVLEAARWAFWKIKTQWPDAMCFYAMPIQRSDRETADSLFLLDPLRQMANRYNFKIIEAHTESGIVKDFEVNGSAGRYLSDGLHPNTAGQILQGKFYAAKILANYIV